MRTEGDCLKLLRRANLPLETLQEILSDRAARKFHAVRRALAAHPRTPRTDALALVATLFWRDLAFLSGDARVHPAIRRAADLDLLRRLPDMAVAEKVDLARIVGRGTLQVLRLDLDPRVLVSVARKPVRDRGRRRPGGDPAECHRGNTVADRGTSALGSCGRPCAAPFCATLSYPRPLPCPF